MQWLMRLWSSFVALLFGERHQITIQVLDGDLFPSRIPPNRVVVLMDDGPYAAAMRCPCGCGETIELMLMEGVCPRWDLVINSRKQPTLVPSVWRQTGCCSHFWLRNGKIIWCK